MYHKKYLITVKELYSLIVNFFLHWILFLLKFNGEILFFFVFVFFKPSPGLKSGFQLKVGGAASRQRCTNVWGYYCSDTWFHSVTAETTDGHFRPISHFTRQAAGKKGRLWWNTHPSSANGWMGLHLQLNRININI